MESVDIVLTKIRDLSSEKEQLTEQLNAENDNLRSMVDSVTAERDAFMGENDAAVQLLMAHSVHQSLTNTRTAVTLKSSVEKLMIDREQQKAMVGELQTTKAHLVKENTRLTQENKELAVYRATVQEMELQVEDLKKSEKDSKKRRDTISSDRRALQARVLLKQQCFPVRLLIFSIGKTVKKRS